MTDHTAWKLALEVERLQRLLDMRPPYYCHQCDCARCGNTRVRTAPDITIVHRVCQWLREESGVQAGFKMKCERCPAHFDSPYGPGTQACVLRAQELIDVVQEAKSRPAEKHGWISVYDRLPADGDDVLYAFNGSTFRGRYLGSNNENSLPTFGGEAGWLTGDVEFWQPTPKAPESTHLGKTSWS